MTSDQIDTGALRRCACANIRRIDRVVIRHYDEILAPSGLYTTQYTLPTTMGIFLVAPFAGLLAARLRPRLPIVLWALLTGSALFLLTRAACYCCS